jgi:hypothetical protein
MDATRVNGTALDSIMYGGKLEDATGWAKHQIIFVIAKRNS